MKYLRIVEYSFLILLGIGMGVFFLKYDKKVDKRMPIYSKLYLLKLPKKNAFQLMIQSNDGSINVNLFITEDELETFKEQIDNKERRKLR